MMRLIPIFLATTTHMDLELTFEDPKYYTRPFTLKTALNLIPDSDVLEFICTENEKDQMHTRRP